MTRRVSAPCVQDEPEVVHRSDVLAALPRYVSSGEFAHQIGVHPSRIHQLVDGGTVTPDATHGPYRYEGGRLRVGGYLFSPATVAGYIEARSGSLTAVRRQRSRAPKQLHLPLLFRGGRA